MKHFSLCSVLLVFGACTLFAPSGYAVTTFDQDVTPDIIFGSGNVNGAFTTDRVGNIEVGLRGKLRFDANNQPQSVYNSDGGGNYTFQAGTPPTGFGFAPGSSTTPVWNFEWSINTDFVNSTVSSTAQLNDFEYVMRLDSDPSAGVNFLVFDPINVANADHGIGNNLTANGAGDDDGPRTAAQYAALIEGNNVAQNSWSYEFFNNSGTALENFDPNQTGTYTIQLDVLERGGGTTLASSSIDIVVVPEPASAALLGAGAMCLLARRKR